MFKKRIGSIIIAFLVLAMIPFMVFTDDNHAQRGGSMATLSVVDTTQTSITVSISGLQYPASSYNAFRFNMDGGAWAYNYTSNPSHTFVGLSPGTTHSFSAEAQLNSGGSWFFAGSCSGTTQSPPPGPPVPSSPPTMTSRTKTSISVSWGSSAGATSYTLNWGIGSATLYDTSTTVYGLSPGTAYQFSVRANNEYGSSAYTAANTYYTESLQPPSTPSAPPSLVTPRGQTYLDLTWGSASGATSYTLDWGSGSTTVAGTSARANGLSPGTTYGFKVKANNDDGSSGWTSTNNATTLPATPSLSVAGTTPSTMTLNIGMSGQWDSVSVTLYNAEGGLTDTQTATYPSTQVTFTGLLQNKGYEFGAYSTYMGFMVSPTSTTVTFTISVARPSNFSWTTPKVSGQGCVVTASEWNSFTSKINQFRAYKSLSAYLFSTVSSEQEFAALLFNQARNALNSLSGHFTGGKTIPSTKSPGDDIMASYLNDLVAAMNSIP